jgi:Opioid growth factor receptor (OGFr) conserved region
MHPLEPAAPDWGHDDHLLGFCAGTGADSEGRTLDQILAWDDRRLESCHDYIQWLFPNDRPSGVNPDAPLLTARHIHAFARRPELRENLLRAYRRMLRFYGLELRTVGDKPRVSRAANWDSRRPIWLTPANHNHLRLTRIIICLDLLGLPDHARALFAFLNDLSRGPDGAAISQTTLAYWRAAAERD